MNSLRLRLILHLVAAAVVVLVAGVLAVYLFFRTSLYHQFDVSLLAEARSIAVLYVRDHDGHYEFNAPPDEERLFRHHHLPDLFCIRRLDGQAVVKSKSLRGRNCPGAERPGMFESLAGVQVWGPEGKRLRAIFVVFVPPAEKGVSPDRFQIVLAAERDDVESLLHHLLHRLVGIMAAATAAMTALVIWAVRSGLAPLQRLAQEARGIGASDLAKRFAVNGVANELLPIHSALNGLLQRMDSALQRESRFTANVAHELRTPVTTLRSLCEVAAASSNPKRIREALRDAQAIAGEMEALICALLALRRADATVGLDAIDIVALARQSWAAIEQAANQKELSRDFHAPQRLIHAADHTCLSAILRNLMENAALHTPVGGSIECRIAGSTIKIRNRPHNIEQADLAHLAEPFWRKDTARSDGAHAGLGLALVDAYCRAMGARFALRLEEDWFTAQVDMAADITETS